MTDLHAPSQLVRIEAQALLALAERLDGPMAGHFERAVTRILECNQSRGRVVVTGMGKSGIVAQKVAATLSSTGSPALFMHPAEALHGDLGMIAEGDVVSICDKNQVEFVRGLTKVGGIQIKSATGVVIHRDDMVIL